MCSSHYRVYCRPEVQTPLLNQLRSGQPRAMINWVLPPPCKRATLQARHWTAHVLLLNSGCDEHFPCGQQSGCVPPWVVHPNRIPVKGSFHVYLGAERTACSSSGSCRRALSAACCRGLECGALRCITNSNQQQAWLQHAAPCWEQGSSEPCMTRCRTRCHAPALSMTHLLLGKAPPPSSPPQTLDVSCRQLDGRGGGRCLAAAGALLCMGTRRR